MDIESIIAATRRAQQVDDGAIGNCSRIWHVGFFFDGVHRHLEQDLSEHRISNISRLFRAYPSALKNTDNG